VDKRSPRIEPSHRDFFLQQHVFFVASAAPGARVNVSPRSTDCFRVLRENAVAYLDRTGSENETAAHLRVDGRMTIMFCAFAGPPRTVRLYGHGTVHHRLSKSYADLLAEHFGGTAPLGARQFVQLDVELVLRSCGFGVPLFDYRAERTVLDDWSKRSGPAGIEAFWRERNTRSIDGLPTGLFEDDEAKTTI
jgi:Pyridoxamine 5'-phosphate oxidase